MLLLLAACGKDASAPRSASLPGARPFDSDCKGKPYLPKHPKDTFPTLGGDPMIAKPAAVALRFAEALAGGRYDAAHAMLENTSKARLTPAALRARYEKMVDYWHRPANRCTVLMVNLGRDYRFLRDQGAIAWVYVGLGNQENVASEAVAVLVHPDLSLTIRDEDWGRP